MRFETEKRQDEQGDFNGASENPVNPVHPVKIPLSLPLHRLVLAPLRLCALALISVSARCQAPSALRPALCA